jgi:hypothetical protein
VTDYYAHAPHTSVTLERLAREEPQVLACMHGSAWCGDGASLVRALARSLGGGGVKLLRSDNIDSRVLICLDTNIPA